MRARCRSPAHSSIARASCERSRRFLRSHALRFSGEIRATFAALRLIGASKAAVGREVVAFYDEEIFKIDVQRASASGETPCGLVRPRRYEPLDAVSLQGGDDFLVGDACPDSASRTCCPSDAVPVTFSHQAASVARTICSSDRRSTSMICLGSVPAHGMRVRLVPPTVCPCAGPNRPRCRGDRCRRPAHVWLGSLSRARLGRDP